MQDTYALAGTSMRNVGQLFRTDVDDAACAANAAQIGPDADGRAGGCDNIRLLIGGTPLCRYRYAKAPIRRDWGGKDGDPYA